MQIFVGINPTGGHDLNGLFLVFIGKGTAVVDAELYFSQAVRYAKGMGIQQDYTQALEYINKAEEKGDANMKEKCIQARTYILAKMADGNH